MVLAALGPVSSQWFWLHWDQSWQLPCLPGPHTLHASPTSPASQLLLPTPLPGHLPSDQGFAYRALSPTLKSSVAKDSTTPAPARCLFWALNACLQLPPYRLLPLHSLFSKSATISLRMWCLGIPRCSFQNMDNSNTSAIQVNSFLGAVYLPHTHV